MILMGQQLLVAVKNDAGIPGKQLLLNIGGFESYSLRPVATCRRGLQSTLDISCLTNCRNHFVSSFLTEFSATEQRTAAWLCDYVHSDNSRILFMLDDPHQKPIGYMGLAYIDWAKAYGEADAVVKGDNNTPKGLMSCALLTMLGWALDELKLRTIGVRVLSDNPALQFYKRLGFEELKRVPLKKISMGEMVNWVEDTSLATSKRFLVHHVWNPGIRV
jgi:RimJ/RimL family protein N-acetyltransferase